MDTPSETQLESASDASNLRNTLPGLSQAQTTLDGPVPELRKRKSFRTRPTEVPGRRHAIGSPSPLKENELQPEIRRARSSKMSLFNLFSKPKVEKLRGYAESGLDTPSGPSQAMSKSDVAAPKMDLLVRVQNVDDGPGRPRPSSSKSHAARSGRYTATEALPPLPNGGRIRAFEPSPLFQVWPQATKHGVLEVSTMSPEMVLSKPARGRISSSFFTPHAEAPSLNVPGDRGSVDFRAAAKPAASQLPNGSLANHSIPKKLVVLVTSGFLLQYAETGANDRAPEKVLQLGRDSAAYASDLIPGRHHVLQIAQQVDQYGSMSSSHHSLLSRFTLRNHAARRTTNNLLLVMPDAQEMGEWMSVIRKEIEIQGGKRVRSDSGASRLSKAVVSESAKVDLKKTPSQSHRYQVKRSPDGPAAITTPSSERSEPLPSPSLAQGEGNKLQHTGTTSTKDIVTDASASPEMDSQPSRPRAASDAASDSSSTAVSVNQHNLDRLRNTARESHTSTVATSVTAASRTNSMSSTPPLEKVADGSQVPAKSPFRSLSSYSLAHRGSATPLSLKGTPVVDPTMTAGQQKAILVDRALDSPVIGHGLTGAEPTRSLMRNRLPVTQSVPNLKDRSAQDARRDPKFQHLSSVNTRERPESFIADLPKPTTWVTKAAASTHATSMHDTTAARAMQKAAGDATATYSLQSRPLRSGSNSFSLPLRVNPTPASPPKSQKSANQATHKLLSPIPAVHCLTAKIEITAQPKMERRYLSQGKDESSPVETSSKTSRTTSARPSLFPTTVVSPPTAMPVQPGIIRRSPSAQTLTAYEQVQTNGARLPRPNSLQVRTTYAPFLSSKRIAGPVPVQHSPATVPIRSLKPSRSVATMQTSPSTVPEEPFNFGTGKLQDEAADKATPLPSSPADGALPPLPGSRPPSRTRKIIRKGSRTSLSEMDYGISLAGLGPPAPPPQAPLPEIPSGSRPASRQTSSRLSMVRSGTPIGVAIGDSHDERMVRSPSPAVMGLGIQVGGAD